MKLTDILREQQEEVQEIEAARELDRKMDQFQNGNQKLLFRAEDRIVDDYMIRKIRSMRKPRDTAPFIDAVVMALERTKYRSVPRRNASKFAVTEEEFQKLSMYGSAKYVVFPHEKGKIASLEGDAYTLYFDKAERNASKAGGMYKARMDLGFEVLNRLAAAFSEIENRGSGDDGIYMHLMEIVEYDWDGIGEKAVEAARGAGLEERTILNALKRFYDLINQYFKDLKSGIHAGGEILFDGPKYLLVNREFFNEYFDWNGSAWRLKQIYRD